VSERAPDLPPAGWYPDPAGAATLRWWNGVTWSDSTHPRPGYLAPHPTSPPEPPIASPWTSPTPFPEYATAEPPAAARRRSGWVVATALLLALALLAGLLLWLPQALGGRHELDTDAVATQVADALTAQSGQQFAVSCPGGVALEAGAQFTCQATDPDGNETDILVTQTDDQGDVSWRPAR
jgi:hypothetical protein